MFGISQVTGYSEADHGQPDGPEVGFGDALSGVLQADSVIHRMAQLLFAPEIFLGSLNRCMTRQKLNLLQCSSRQMAESRTRAAEIMWSEVRDSGVAGRSFDDIAKLLSA